MKKRRTSWMPAPNSVPQYFNRHNYKTVTIRIGENRKYSAKVADYRCFVRVEIEKSISAVISHFQGESSHVFSSLWKRTLKFLSHFHHYLLNSQYQTNTLPLVLASSLMLTASAQELLRLHQNISRETATTFKNKSTW